MTLQPNSKKEDAFGGKVRVAFMGSPEFATPSLKALLEDPRYEVVAVYTQPPRPKNRGHQLERTPVHQLAEGWGVPVETPSSLKSLEAQAHLASLSPDVVVVVAYGLLLPKTVLDIPPLGCINVHASLLPRWRGAAPIHRAILEGDPTTGITLMKMDEGLDTGPFFATQEVSILPDATYLQLQETLSKMGADLLSQELFPFLKGQRPLQLQPTEGITYASKVKKEEGELDWNMPAFVLERKIRALNPSPGTWCTWRQKRLKILEAKLEPQTGIPGKLLDDRMLISCKEGSLRPLQVLLEGGKPQSLDSFLNGYTPAEDDFLA
ncbi:MAG: methionyl-tRNA formyltransferase [Alphaproteobacteria bacterium]